METRSLPATSLTATSARRLHGPGQTFVDGECRTQVALTQGALTCGAGFFLYGTACESGLPLPVLLAQAALLALTKMLPVTAASLLLTQRVHTPAPMLLLL